MLISWDTITDQRIINSNYEPLISETEHEILLNRYNEKNIEFIQSELNNINTSERNTIKEFQIFVNVLQKSGKYYKKASYVQQAQISSLLFSNIFVDKKKKLTIKVNSSLEPIFSWKVSSFGDDGIWTHV